MQRLLPVLFSVLTMVQIGCIPNKDAIKDHMTGSWDLTDHCHEFGFVLFRSDGSGTLSVFDDCVVGYSCINVLPFHWSVDEKAGILTVTYDNQSTAQFICSEGTSSNSGIHPATETSIVSSETQVIALQGYTFEKR